MMANDCFVELAERNLSQLLCQKMPTFHIFLKTQFWTGENKKSTGRSNGISHQRRDCSEGNEELVPCFRDSVNCTDFHRLFQSTSSFISISKKSAVSVLSVAFSILFLLIQLNHLFCPTCHPFLGNLVAVGKDNNTKIFAGYAVKYISKASSTACVINNLLSFGCFL